MKTVRGSTGIARLFNIGCRWGWVINATPRRLYSRKRDPVPIVQEVGWAPDPVWTGVENLASPEFNLRIIQLVASGYTYYAIRTLI